MRKIPVVVVFMLCFLFLLSTSGCGSKKDPVVTKSPAPIKQPKVQSDGDGDGDVVDESNEDKYNRLKKDYSSKLKTLAIDLLKDDFKLSFIGEIVVYNDILFVGMDIDGTKYFHECPNFSTFKSGGYMYIEIAKWTAPAKKDKKFQSILLIIDPSTYDMYFYSLFSPTELSSSSAAISSLPKNSTITIEFDKFVDMPDKSLVWEKTLINVTKQKGLLAKDMANNNHYALQLEFVND
jgi:hypothetical protein